MADEVIKIDKNYKGSVAGWSEASNEIRLLRVNDTTNRLLVENSALSSSLDSVSVSNNSSGSLAVNIIGGSLTATTGTSTSIDWIAGTRMSGGSISVNMVEGSISVATGTPVSIDWVAGTRMSGGSIAVNVVAGNISVSTGTTVWISNGTIKIAGGTVLAINAGGTVNAQKYGDWNIDSIGAITSGSIQLVESRQIVGYVINNGGTVQVVNGSGSVQLISPYINISSGSVGINYTSGGSLSVNVLNTPAISISSGSVGINYASGGSISVNVRQLANGSVQLMDSRQVIGSVINAGGSVSVRPDTSNSWSYHYSSGATGIYRGTASGTLGAGLYNYITDLIFSTNDAQLASSVYMTDSSGTILGPYYLEMIAGRGVAISLNTPRKATESSSVFVSTTAAIATTVDVMGFTAP
jgi:hypothetical protein